MSDEKFVNFRPETPEFCRRVCAGRATRWALPHISSFQMITLLAYTVNDGEIDLDIKYRYAFSRIMIDKLGLIAVPALRCGYHYFDVLKA